MEKYIFQFDIADKSVYDYDKRGYVSINYNPTINDAIFKAIRNIFERGISGEKNQVVRFFDIKEDAVKDIITVITDVYYDFDKASIYADIIPMRKRDYAKFNFSIAKRDYDESIN